jgi:hypothetical protein
MVEEVHYGFYLDIFGFLKQDKKVYYIDLIYDGYILKNN